jgi:hypothetical protein
MNLAMLYDCEDTTLPISLPPHGKVTATGLWLCEQEDCDGIHHYYRKYQ